MQTPEPIASSANDAAKSVATNSTNLKTSDGTGYKTYKRKKKDEELYKKEKRTKKEIITDILHYVTIFILFAALIIWALCITSEADHMSRNQHTSIIDRPATTITGSKFIIVSNNEFCNYIIEEAMERNASAAEAGRVMFMCMYATTPHLISPHAQQIFITISGNGTITDSIVNKQRRSTTSTLDGDAGSSKSKGKYSIGWSQNVEFQRRLFEMSDGLNAGKAMSILQLRTKNFAKIPMNNDLHETLRKYKFEIQPIKCAQYFTSWGTIRVVGEYVDQSYFMRHILGSSASKCYQGKTTECQKLHHNFYESMDPIFEKSSRDNFGNPFRDSFSTTTSTPETTTVPGNSNMSANSTEPTVIDVGSVHFVIPNIEGADDEIGKNNRKLKELIEEHLGDHPDTLWNLPKTLKGLYETADTNMIDETSMTGFIIIDSNGSISIGAGGLNEPGGSRICHQGMFLDNNNRHNTIDEHSYRNRFFPFLTVNPKTSEIRSVTLILARNQLHAIQTVANFISLALVNSQRLYSNQIEANRKLKVVYENTIRSPILLQTDSDHISFMKGMPYSHVYNYQAHASGAKFHESLWEEFKMDILGATMKNGTLKGYYIDQDGEFAAMAAQ